MYPVTRREDIRGGGHFNPKLPSCQTQTLRMKIYLIRHLEVGRTVESHLVVQPLWALTPLEAATGEI